MDLKQEWIVFWLKMTLPRQQYQWHAKCCALVLVNSSTNRTTLRQINLSSFNDDLDLFARFLQLIHRRLHARQQKRHTFIEHVYEDDDRRKQKYDSFIPILSIFVLFASAKSRNHYTRRASSIFIPSTSSERLIHRFAVDNKFFQAKYIETSQRSKTKVYVTDNSNTPCCCYCQRSANTDSFHEVDISLKFSTQNQCRNRILYVFGIKLCLLAFWKLKIEVFCFWPPIIHIAEWR